MNTLLTQSKVCCVVLRDVPITIFSTSKVVFTAKAYLTVRNRVNFGRAITVRWPNLPVFKFESGIWLL